MSIDCRARLHKSLRDIPRDEVFDAVLPEAVERNGELAARGLLYKELPALGLSVGDRAITLREQDGRLRLDPRLDDDAVVAELEAGGLSNLVQERRHARRRRFLQQRQVEVVGPSAVPTLKGVKRVDDNGNMRQSFS